MPFGFDLLHDFYFGGNRGMVDAGQPQRTVTLHALEADNGILHRFVHRVPHVKLPRYVGRRHHDRKRHFVRVDFRAERAAFRPIFVNAVLELLRIVSRLHFFHKSHP